MTFGKVTLSHYFISPQKKQQQLSPIMCFLVHLLPCVCIISIGVHWMHWCGGESGSEPHSPLHSHLNHHNSCFLLCHLTSATHLFGLTKEKKTNAWQRDQDLQRIYDRNKNVDGRLIKPPPAAHLHTWHAWHCTDVCRHVSLTQLLFNMLHILLLPDTTLQLLL